MTLAKNYRTVTKFVKVMPRILWPLFFPDTVYNSIKIYCVYFKILVQPASVQSMSHLADLAFCHQMSDFKAKTYQIRFRLGLCPRPR